MNDKMKELSAGMADAVGKAGAYTVTVAARRRLPASGIALDNETILTAAHVIEDDENIIVVLPDGREMSAELLGFDPRSDLAALKLASPDAAPAELAEDVSVGQLVLAIGRPFSRGVEASLGILSAKGGPLHGRHGSMLESHYRTDAIPYPGFSGGPLVDVDGKVIGLNTSGLGIGNSLVIPIQSALKIVEMLKEHGSVKRGFLGISGQPVELSEEAQTALGREQESGLLLVGVEEDGPAAKGGLVVSDILVGIGGEAVANHRELLYHLTGHLVGQEVDVEVLRGGAPKTLKVEIGERPEMPMDEHRRSRKA
ncbi:MAG TPA: trypsin-like peptidase domain-containing protein, partial [Anaerolineales bacterium]|nr:trypsin-like peptidase domain-containing protein [Anaerolineales bacterium]